MILTCLFMWGSAHAEPLVSLVVGKVNHKVKSADYRKIESALEQTANALKACSTSFAVFDDPLVGRQNSYVVKDAGAYCNVVLIKDSLWKYNCKLLTADTKGLAESIVKRIDTRELLGDLNDFEQSVFFNQKKCIAEEL